ncbi:hypothetical protein GBA65_06565 [Rubrobacter marinus]|uniref:Uncharacterized protein n=1 Tax=Rubrobacter marinus TaxID=2653852 RepID=A0A6G8PVN3_9ACTN|nr:hypothetical protein [Rubrobacter marinus]QIN78227.1 hypothetical protein GBA65_06565 [Rubrobacter marinus]
MSRSGAPGRREPAPEREEGLHPRYRRAFGCVTWVYMGILAFLAVATLLALPVRYTGDGAGFGQILSRLSFYGLVLILPAMALAFFLGSRTYRVERAFGMRVGAGIGALIGWSCFFVLSWAAIAYALEGRDQLFRPVLFAGLDGSPVLYVFPVLLLAATALLLYALYATNADYGRRRAAALLSGGLALVAGLLVLVVDPDPLGLAGALVSTLAGAAGGWVSGFGYARAGGNEMIPPGSTIRPSRPRGRR